MLAAMRKNATNPLVLVPVTKGTLLLTLKVASWLSIVSSDGVDKILAREFERAADRVAIIQALLANSICFFGFSPSL